MEFNDSDDKTSNPRIAAGTQTLDDIIEIRLSRRAFLGGVTAATVSLAVGGCATEEAVQPRSTVIDFDFEEIARGLDQTHHVAAGHTAKVVIRWGDALFDDSPAFDPMQQSETAQPR